MTKDTPRKHAIRAYMAEHGVNYTTAARALSGTATRSAAESPRSRRIRTLRAALTTGSQDTINAALRAAAPGPGPWSVAYALASLAHHSEALTRVTEINPSTSPQARVWADLLRIAVHATASHGHHRYQRRGQAAADICSAAALANPATASNLRDARLILAGLLDSLADDAVLMALHAATESGLDTAASTVHSPHASAQVIQVAGDDVAEALLLVAHDLTVQTNTASYPLRETVAYFRDKTSPHILIVTAEPLTADDIAQSCPGDLADWRYAPDRDHHIECPGLGRGRCQGWEECMRCRLLDPDAAEELSETGEAHGVEHQSMWFGWATATGNCSLQDFPDAWIDSAGDLDLPPGRYAIGFDWDEGCDLSLTNYQV